MCIRDRREGDGRDMTFSQNYSCPEHGVSIDELTPRMFSFNNPYGACPKCTGLGSYMSIDPDLIIACLLYTSRCV